MGRNHEFSPGKDLMYKAHYLADEPLSPNFEREEPVFLAIGVAKMSTPHLATPTPYSQEQKYQCHLASPFLATYIGYAHNFEGD